MTQDIITLLVSAALFIVGAVAYRALGNNRALAHEHERAIQREELAMDKAVNAQLRNAQLEHDLEKAEALARQRKSRQSRAKSKMHTVTVTAEDLS